MPEEPETNVLEAGQETTVVEPVVQPEAKVETPTTPEVKPEVQKTQPDEYYKGIQRRLDSEQKANALLRQKLSGVEDEIAKFKDWQGKKEAEDKGETYTETHYPKLQQERVGTQQLYELSLQRIEGINEMLEDVGMGDTDPRLTESINVFNSGKIEEGYRMAKAVIRTVKSEKKKNQDNEFKVKVDNQVKEVLKAKGILDSDIAIPTGGSGSAIPTDMAKFRTWVKDLPYEDFKKREKEIDTLMQQGRIK